MRNLLTVLVFGASATALLASPYRFETFSVPYGGSISPSGINNHGDIVGTSRSGNWSYGFVRKADGSFMDLTGMGLNHVMAINDSGVFVGYWAEIKAFSAPTVYVYDGSLEMQPYPFFPTDINNAGLITGYRHVFADTLRQTGVLYSYLSGSQPRIFRYPSAEVSAANGINDTGTVVGNFSLEDVFLRSADGFVRDSAGAMTSLSPIPEIDDSIWEWGFTGINNRGDMIGTFRSNPWAEASGFVLRADGTYDVFSDFFPSDINDWGVMVGRSADGNAVIATPSAVPEPATSLLAGSVVILALIGRKMRLKSSGI